VNPRVRRHIQDTGRQTELRTSFQSFVPKDTHKLSVFAGHQDVHLGALGADDLAAQGVFAQVDLAAVGLVDGDRGHLPQDLDTRRTQGGQCSPAGLHEYTAGRP